MTLNIELTIKVGTPKKKYKIYINASDQMQKHHPNRISRFLGFVAEENPPEFRPSNMDHRKRFSPPCEYTLIDTFKCDNYFTFCDDIRSDSITTPPKMIFDDCGQIFSYSHPACVTLFHATGNSAPDNLRTRKEFIMLPRKISKW